MQAALSQVPAQAGLIARFDAQQARAPDALAVIDPARRLSYAELAQASRRFAAALTARGVRPGQSVALALPRGWPLLAAVLGVLRVGAVVVPLDRSSPPARQAFMLQDAGCVGWVQAGAELDAVLPAGCWQAPVEHLLDHCLDGWLEPSLPPLDIAFLFYTSGTTGQPKAVEVTEAGLLRLAQPGYIRIDAGDRFACLSNPAFDALSFELWAPLLNGGCCVIIADATLRDPARLAAHVAAEQVATLFITVSLFNLLTVQQPDCFAQARQVLIGGEQLNAAAVRAWYRANPGSECQLFNGYGPTECTTFAFCHAIPRDFAGAVVPLGRPLADTGFRLLVDGQREAREGEEGELYLSGGGLARGYRNRPDETAQRFVRLTWLDQGRTRYYRSGDRVRLNAAGLPEYLGRVDRQIKVRGFRIEPGEIEQCLLEHPQVLQVHVCARRLEAEAHELLAFLVLRGSLAHEALATYLQTHLAPFMRPHRLFVLERLPLTANGKVDSAQLLAAGHRPWQAEHEPSGTADQLCLQWLLQRSAQLLGLPALAPQDSFVGSGGDSLKALRLRFEIRQHWQRDLEVTSLLDDSFARLAERLAEALAGAPDALAQPPAPPRCTTGRGVATAEQTRLWFVQQRAPAATAYHVPLMLSLEGPLNLPVLQRALDALVARHEGLRMAFEAGPEGLEQVVREHGAVCQVVAPQRFEMGQWQAFAELLFASPFDVRSGRLFQAYLLPLASERHVLLLHLHHLIVDGWSLNLLFDELAMLYRHGCAGQAPAPVADGLGTLEFAQWQRQWRAQPGYRAQRERLVRLHRDQGQPAPALLPRQSAEDLEARLYPVTLGPDRRVALDRLCAQLCLTRFELLFGLFTWSLYGVTGHARLRIASPVSNRPLAEFEAATGMFANTLLIPSTLDPRLDLRELLRRQSQLLRAVLACQDVALSDLVEDLQLSSQAASAPFDCMFVLENTDYAGLTLPDVTVRLELPQRLQAKCPLTLLVVDGAQGLDCWWEYQLAYFDRQQLQALAGLFGQGLDLLLEQPEARLADLVEPYRCQLPAASEGPTQVPGFGAIADWFEHQVRSSPEATALVDRSQAISYARLDRLADGLAGQLLQRQAWPASAATLSVALYLEPSVEQVVALLALAKLNVTAIALDPAYPPALLQQILAQARPHAVLFSAATEGPLSALDTQGMARYPVTLTESVAPPPAYGPRGLRPLYTLFTSGSTGRPKGVSVPDRTLCNLLQWQRGDGGLAASASTLQFSMLAFDVSFQEVFSTLCGGGCYHLITPAWRLDAEALLVYLASAGIQRIFMPYVALQQVASSAVAHGRYPSQLREVITAGEQLLCTEAIRQWFTGMPQARLFNHYGPTETHVVSAYRLGAEPGRWPARAPIGQAVANARLLLVDEQDRPLPAGCSGYLLVAGAMVNRCYLDDDSLNLSRFVSLPDPDKNGAVRLYYRTGDRVQLDHQGQLHYLGRDDQQVKLSGQRLELGQIEAALMDDPAVVDAVVRCQDEPPALVAYLQLQGPAPSAETLDALLVRQLPAHVRIEHYRRLDTWPRTPSGKVDRKALDPASGVPLPRGLAQRQGHGVPPTGLEQQLSALFEEVVGRPIGLDQRFFDAGATSLGLMRLKLRCDTSLATPLSMADLFEQVTVRRLAAHLSRQASGAPRPAPCLVPTTAGSHDGALAIVGMALKVPGADDLEAFWRLVIEGERGIELFPAAEGWVGARSQLKGLVDFDPAYFGISRQEARLMDPQQRHLLMGCVHALQQAGVDPRRTTQRIGLIASAGENTYFQRMLRQAGEGELPDGFQLALHHDKDFLATKVAYHLDLKGPALSAQAACGSSLIAVHLAGHLLRQGDSDLMLAGGVLIDTSLTQGYRYRPQHILSRDGICRPFSEDASGTIGASGYAVVVLKTLARARADGDRIYALVEGSALNNDGQDKLSYTAPSVAGQAAVIRAALARAGRRGDQLGYVEAHGTGTLLGDPVEVAALQQALGPVAANSCALSSVKSQLGHLGAAAGAVGLIRAALAVYHGVVPANLGFRRINPQIDLAATPFYIPGSAHPWPHGQPRVAGVSSFGIGGTNAHVVVAEPPEQMAAAVEPGATRACLLLSAHSRSALERDLEATAAYLERHPQRYAEVLAHLQRARRPLPWRFAAQCPSAAAAPALLRDASLRPDQASPAHGQRLAASGLADVALLEAWRAGVCLDWPAEPACAPAPWDFPPSAFDLEPFDFQPAAPPVVEPAQGERQPPADWLYQRQWSRYRRLDEEPSGQRRDTLVVCGDEELQADCLANLSLVYRRVVQLRVGAAYRCLNPHHYEFDPLDRQGLQRLLELLEPSAQQGLDWLHSLPLSVRGEVSPASMAHAQWACLDSLSTLLQAWGQQSRQAPLRLWLLSYQACPVDGEVQRPELGALAGVNEVVPQEYRVRCHWLDLPSPAWQPQAARLAAVFGAPENTPRRLALRGDYLWQPQLLPYRAPPPSSATALLPAQGVFLVLGGSGGIGASLCLALLQAPGRRVLLLSRRAELPASLQPYRERVEVIAADLADLQGWPEVLAGLSRQYPRLEGVIHAAGVGAGGLIQGRDGPALARAMGAKTLGMLALESLIARLQPRFVFYCSSMASIFGGAGQLDYAAANGVLDGFAHYRAADAPGCIRMGVNWDIWRDVGMATTALATDAAHQAHLALGLSVEEGVQIFRQALQVQLPQLLVSTTPIETARQFYPSRQGRLASPLATDTALREQLQDCLCQWLGLERLDPAASLYALGADSLTLLDLIDELAGRHGISLQLSQFSHKVSLEEVLVLAEQATAVPPVEAEPEWDSSVRLDLWTPGRGPALVCLLHPVGGDVQAYRALASALPPHVRLCVIADPGLANPGLPPIGLAERAALYLRALERAYPRQAHDWHLVGWSFGAWVAQAMGGVVQAGGQVPPPLYLIDPPAPDAGVALARFADRDIEEVFLRELTQHWPDAASPGARNRIPAELQDYVRRLLQCCRRNIASMADFQLTPLEQGSSHVFVATHALRDRAEADLRQHWQALLPPRMGWQRLETDHYGIVEGPWAESIARVIADGAGRTGQGAVHER
ncbi:MAG: amino acid adenylation domain-containing protein [Pseudomonas sp.]|uniref:hybrid non-ribosomal peptide synthetase/type I polyketide synthase n=1 Tax=Pseudomonas sp. TaxID=306 RepID=UPI0033998CC9